MKINHFKPLSFTLCQNRPFFGEIAGIQKKNIDLDRKIFTIKEVIVWIKGIPKIKPLPKNGSFRVVFINQTMERIITRYLKRKVTILNF